MTTNIGVTIFAKIAHIGLTIVLSILLFVLTPYSRFITVRANYYLFFFSVSKIFEVHSSYLRDRCYWIRFLTFLIISVQNRFIYTEYHKIIIPDKLFLREKRQSLAFCIEIEQLKCFRKK